MVDQIAVVTVTVPAGTGTFDLRDPSLTEAWKAAILIFSGSPTDSSDESDAILGIGFVTEPNTGMGNNEEAMGVRAEDGTAPNCETFHGDARAMVFSSLADPAVADFSATYSSTLSGGSGAGVQLNVTVNARGSIKCTAILFAGLARAATDGCLANTTGTGSAVATVGGTTPFDPDLLIFTASNGALNIRVQDATPNLGFALTSAGFPQVCAFQRWDDITSPSDSDGFFRSLDCFGHFAPTRELARLTSIGSGTFTLTSDAGTPDAHYLALKFSGPFRLAVANMAVAAATGTQAFNAFGFTPDLVFGMSHTTSTVDAATQDGALVSACSYFVTGKYGSRAYAAAFQEGSATPTAKTRHEDVALLQYDHAASVIQRATWVGPSGSGGFVLNFSTASAGGFMTALGIQLNWEAPAIHRRRRAARKVRARLRRRQVLVQGRPVGSPPLTRFLSLVARARRAMQRRLRWKPIRIPLTAPAPTVGLEAEEAKGMIAAPGLVRGHVFGPGVPTDELQ